jgi:hypothetical protein
MKRKKKPASDGYLYTFHGSYPSEQRTLLFGYVLCCT